MFEATAPPTSDQRALKWVLVLALPALCGLFAVHDAASTWERVRTNPEKRTLKVTGSATKRITSDLIVWTGDLETRGMDRAAAYRQLRAHTEITRQFLIDKGVPEADIRTSAVSSHHIVERETVFVGDERIERPVDRGWATHQSITVSSSSIATVEKASREVTSLLEQGVPISSRAPTYHYTKLGEVKVDMLAAASADAQERADRIVKAAGGTGIGDLWHADMGVINVNPANSTATSWQGNNDKTSYEKDIITIVHLTFELP